MSEKLQRIEKSRFLRACKGLEVDCTPVWFMRQAGRYMEEYRTIREKYTLLEICKHAELAAQVTLQPMQRFEFDAAIIFADILLPLQGLGVDFEFAKGEGPVIHNPIRTQAQVAALRTFEPREELKSVLDGIRLVRQSMSERLALIGFAGAPFTIASYMIEGGSSRHFLETKLFMYREEAAWHQLMKKLAEVTVRYLNAQAESGADALQLFDSWAGCLSEEDYVHYVLPYSRMVFDGLQGANVPLIHFSTGAGGFLDRIRQAGGSVVGVDWRIPMRSARLQLGDDVSVQGNLDPGALLAPENILQEKVKSVLRQCHGRKGHIFNLGHGVLPCTPVRNVELVVDLVHKLTSVDSPALFAETQEPAHENAG